jgi:hypothetical protein
MLEMVSRLALASLSVKWAQVWNEAHESEAVQAQFVWALAPETYWATMEPVSIVGAGLLLAPRLARALLAPRYGPAWFQKVCHR